MKAIVTGAMGTFPVGGVVWDYGQYLVGLERLGLDVYYLEDTGLEASDPDTWLPSADPSRNARYLAQALRSLSPSLEDRWHFRAADDSTYGMDCSRLHALVEDVDVFVNVSGLCLMREEYLPARRKVFIDTDPGWNHFYKFPSWDAKPGWKNTHGYRAHDVFFTYAERIGSADCPLPSMGLEWHPTRPPVVTDLWATATFAEPQDRWTTVMTWDNFSRRLEYGGVEYGAKEREFHKYERLPQLVDVDLELAVGGVDPPQGRFEASGWNVVDGPDVTSTADRYARYVSGSRGEIGIAKHVYVATRSGWFSCRSVCYLASGRPVVADDTGFSFVLPTDAGLLAVRDAEGAAAAITRVETDYQAHSEAARNIALERFEAKVVLSEVLDRAEVSP